jgi:hypothetical protein
MCSDSRQGTPSTALRNWRESDLPFFPRLWVALRNTARKVRTGKTCCGHYGEPGC